MIGTKKRGMGRGKRIGRFSEVASTRRWEQEVCKESTRGISSFHRRGNKPECLGKKC